MLTKKDKLWLSKMSDTHLVKIVPYNPKVKDIFKIIEKEIKSVLGQEVSVQHRGASSFGISGKGDLDIYVPVEESGFEETFKKFKKLYGEPGSYYPLERVRWNKMVEGIEAEVMLMSENSEAWKKGVMVEDYFKTHPNALEAYRKLKEEAGGLSMREYYTRKTEFVNLIYRKAKKLKQEK